MFNKNRNRTRSNATSRNDKIRGSLIGGAIGDALGYQIEFSRGIKNRQITKYNRGKGIISDDTQMTLFTANALLWRETRMYLKGISMSPTDAIYLGYLDWLETQQACRKSDTKITCIKDIKELKENRAPGNTCISALSSGKKGTIEKPINNSKGCGTIMRVAPIGLYINDPINAGRIAAEASAITHGNHLGIIPSYICAVIINLLVNSDITLEEAIDKSVNIYKENFKINDNEANHALYIAINNAKELSKKNISDIEAIKQLGEGWVAEEALAIALYSCLKYQNRIKDTLICAINHDGDSDSTGAIAGNIIGAYLGYSNIEKYYIDNLELKDIILEIADDLSVQVPVSEYSDNNDKSWLDKYVYCTKRA